MAVEFFDQANLTLASIAEAMCVYRASSLFLVGARTTDFVSSTSSYIRKKRDLQTISNLGGFIKDSAGILGACKVFDSCFKMQQYGRLRDEEKGSGLTEKIALEKIIELHQQLKGEYAEAENWLKLYLENLKPS